MLDAEIQLQDQSITPDTNPSLAVDIGPQKLAVETTTKEQELNFTKDSLSRRFLEIVDQLQNQKVATDSKSNPLRFDVLSPEDQKLLSELAKVKDPSAENIQKLKEISDRYFEQRPNDLDKAYFGASFDDKVCGVGIKQYVDRIAILEPEVKAEKTATNPATGVDPATAAATTTAAATLTPQQQQAQWERNYYNNRAIDGTTNDPKVNTGGLIKVLEILNPTELTKIQAAEYADPADKVSAMVKAFQAAANQSLVVRNTSAAYFEAGEFLRQDPTKPFTLSAGAIKAMELCADDVTLIGTHRAELITAVGGLKENAATQDTFFKSNPNGTPVNASGMTAQQQQAQWERNYYNNRAIDGTTNDPKVNTGGLIKVLDILNPTELAKIQATQYADPADKVSAMIKAFQAAANQSLVVRNTSAAYFEAGEFLRQDPNKPFTLSAGAIKAMELCADDVTLIGTHRAELITAVGGLKENAATQDTFFKNNPLGTPVNFQGLTAQQAKAKSDQNFYDQRSIEGNDASNHNGGLSKILSILNLKALEDIKAKTYANLDDKVSDILREIQAGINKNGLVGNFAANDKGLGDFLRQDPSKKFTLTDGAVRAMEIYAGQLTPGLPNADRFGEYSKAVTDLRKNLTAQDNHFKNDPNGSPV